MTVAPVPKPTSLRAKLLRWLLLPLLVFVPAAALVMYSIAVQPALDSLDRALGSTAYALAELLVTQGDEVSLPVSPQTARALAADPYDRVSLAVTDPGGRLLHGSALLATMRPALAPGEQRWFDARLDGTAVRVAALGAVCGHAGGPVCTVLVAESRAKRVAAERAVVIGSTLVALTLAAMLITLALVAVRSGLRPLATLGEEIEKRSLANLRPVEGAGVPLEVAPLAGAINRLLERLQRAAGAQKKFIADAAHQLRTPLATLRAESELALLEPHPPELRGTLERLQAGSERAVRLAQQLLALAVAENVTAAAPAREVDLKALATEVGLEWVHPALDAGIDLGFELEEARVPGHEHLLRELLANLLHNAIKYAGRGARVTLRCARRDGGVRLEVEDDGPGIAEADRERVWERFQRGSGAAGSGSGLGLAIVRDIALAHGAHASLHTGAEGRGLVARVDFPAA